MPTSSQDTPDPIGTPSGGLPAGAPTGPYTPSGLGTLLGNVGTGLAGLARNYFAAGQPSVWGSGAQSVDESGMVGPWEQPQPTPPQTEARAEGQPGQPSPMQPPGPPTQWPPSPIQPKEPEKPDTTGSVPPPEPSKAPPPESHERYIPSPRNRPIGDLGRPDLPLQFAGRYPGGLLPAPYFPQPQELPGVFANSFRTLGGLGSNKIAQIAHALTGTLPQYWAAQQRGEELRNKIAANNFKLDAQRLAQLQAAESRAYGEVWAVFGPGTKGYNEERLREELAKVARDPRFQDDRMLQALDRGLPSVEALMKMRDAANQDNIKALTQAKKFTDWKISQGKLEEQERKKRQQQGQLEGYAAGAGATAPTPGTPESDQAIPPKPDAEPGEKTREWPAAPAPAAEPKETPETSSDDTSESTDDQAAKDTDETPEKTAETPAETPETATKTAETPPPSPSEQLLAQAEGGAPAAGGAPTRLAQADTGTATDAGPQRAQPPQAEMPEWLKRAREGTREGGQTPPSVTLTPRQTPEGLPYYQATPSDRLPDKDFIPPKSAALERAKNFINPYTNQPMPLDQEGVNSRARGLVNGTIKTIQGQKEVPQEVRNIDRMRANEMEAALDKIIEDPKYKGEDVYKAIAKIANNPELAADLRSYVDGDVAVPSGSWNNLNFLKRIIALGHKVDDKFNAANFAVRARTKQSFANGADARNWTSVATLYLHSQEATRLLQEIEKRHPGILKEYLGASKLGTSLRQHFGSKFGPSKEEQSLFAQLDVALGTVATEYVRATSGAAPTVTHRNETLHGLDYKWNEESAVIDQLARMRSFAEDRMKILSQRYNTVLGAAAKKDELADLLGGYAGGTPKIATPLEGKGNDEGNGGYVKPWGDTLGLPYADPKAPGVQDVIRKFAPRAADQEAIDWARAHPQDPRSRQILERN